MILFTAYVNVIFMSGEIPYYNGDNKQLFAVNERIREYQMCGITCSFASLEDPAWERREIESGIIDAASAKPDIATAEDQEFSTTYFSYLRTLGVVHHPFSSEYVRYVNRIEAKQERLYKLMPFIFKGEVVTPATTPLVSFSKVQPHEKLYAGVIPGLPAQLLMHNRVRRNISGDYVDFSVRDLLDTPVGYSEIGEYIASLYHNGSHLLLRRICSQLDTFTSLATFESSGIDTAILAAMLKRDALVHDFGRLSSKFAALFNKPRHSEVFTA